VADKALVTTGVAGAGAIAMESSFGLPIPSPLPAVIMILKGVDPVAVDGTPEITPPAIESPAGNGVAVKEVGPFVAAMV